MHFAHWFINWVNIGPLNGILKLLFQMLTPTGIKLDFPAFQLLVFFCSSVLVVLFDTPGISRSRSQHVSVESSSLFHHICDLFVSRNDPLIS